MSRNTHGNRTARAVRSRFVRGVLRWSVVVVLLLSVGLLASLVIAVRGPDWEKARETKPSSGGLIFIPTEGVLAGGNGWIHRTYHECVMRELSVGAVAPPPLTAAQTESLFTAQFIGSVSWRDDHFDKVNRAKGQRETNVIRSGWPVYAMEYRESRITKGTGPDEPGRWTPIADGLARCTLFWSGSIGVVLAVGWCVWWIVPRAIRLLLGRCVVCGYTLKGLEPGADCPECGCTSPR